MVDFPGNYFSSVVEESTPKKKGSRLERVKTAFSKGREENLTASQKTQISLDHKYFSIPLDDITKRETALSGEQILVPKLIQSLIDSIRKHVSDTEGIFRIGAVQKELQLAKAAMESGGLETFEVFDINTQCGLLKAFLRELPEPLLTYELYSPLLRIATDSSSSKNDKLSNIKEQLTEIEPENYHLLKELFSLFSEIHQHSQQNKMTASNLAIVITPNILYSASSLLHPEIGLSDGPHLNSIITMMIENYLQIFEEEIQSQTSEPPKPKKRYVKKEIKAIYSWEARSHRELSFRAGEVFYLLDKRPDMWYLCLKESTLAYVPGNYVIELPSRRL